MCFFRLRHFAAQNLSASHSKKKRENVKKKRENEPPTLFYSKYWYVTPDILGHSCLIF